jgi:hypothetical protein
LNLIDIPHFPTPLARCVQHVAPEPIFRAIIFHDYR